MLAVLFFCASTLQPQQLTPPPTPESHLLEAKRLLGSIAAPPNADAGKQIAMLQSDFTDFAATYLSGSKSPEPKSGATAPVGTSGTMASDWRAKYAAVERDLTQLIGSADPQSADHGNPPLDAGVKQQLQDVRRNLQLFYAATMGRSGAETPAAAPPARVVDADTGTISALLDRMQALVDRLNGEPGKTGKVEVERQSIDELRAEIAQLKTMLTLKK